MDITRKLLRKEAQRKKIEYINPVFEDNLGPNSEKTLLSLSVPVGVLLWLVSSRLFPLFLYTSLKDDLGWHYGKGGTWNGSLQTLLTFNSGWISSSIKSPVHGDNWNITLYQ